MAEAFPTPTRAAAQPISNPLSPAESAAVRAALLRSLWDGYNPDGSRA